MKTHSLIKCRANYSAIISAPTNSVRISTIILPQLCSIFQEYDPLSLLMESMMIYHLQKAFRPEIYAALHNIGK